MHDVSYYQRLVRKLSYLTITHPDITYAVRLSSQFMHSPTVNHLNIVKRILQYLKGSIGRKIYYRLLHICWWKSIHMEEYEAKSYRSLQRRG